MKTFAIYKFEFEDKEHKKEFEDYLSEQEYVKFKRVRKINKEEGKA